MATAPGATGNWMYMGNGQWAPATYAGISAGEFGNEGGYWYANDGSAPNLGGGGAQYGASNYYAGSRDDIYRAALGMSRDQAAAYLGGRDPDQFLGNAIEGYNNVSSGTGTVATSSDRLKSFLNAAGINPSSVPGFENYYAQDQASALKQAQAIDATNSQTWDWGDVLKMAGTVWGGGYLGGTALGAAQGLGGFGELLMNPSMTGANLGGGIGTAGGAAGGGGMDWFDGLTNLIDASGEAGWTTNPSFADLGGVWGSNLPAGGGMDWYDNLTNLIDTSGQSGW